MKTYTKLSLLIASMLGDDFTFEKHEEVFDTVVKYNALTDLDVNRDIEYVKEVISANIFL